MRDNKQFLPQQHYQIIQYKERPKIFYKLKPLPLKHSLELLYNQNRLRVKRGWAIFRWKINTHTHHELMNPQKCWP